MSRRKVTITERRYVVSRPRVLSRTPRGRNFDMEVLTPNGVVLVCSQRDLPAFTQFRFAHSGVERTVLHDGVGHTAKYCVTLAARLANESSYS